MSYKKRKAPLILSFFLLTSCTALPRGNPIPTPTPATTTIPTPSPDSTTEIVPAPLEPKEIWGFPIDDTHDAFEVPTGGQLGTVLVTIEMDEEEKEGEHHSTISIWKTSDLAMPIQTIGTDGVTTKCHQLVDANFDGHTDFCYTWYRGAKNDTYSLYIWDEEQEQFRFVKSFLGMLEINEKSQALYNCTIGSISSGIREEYRWESGKLVEVSQENYQIQE